jgi:hypothetical protein
MVTPPEAWKASACTGSGSATTSTKRSEVPCDTHHWRGAVDGAHSTRVGVGHDDGNRVSAREPAGVALGQRLQQRHPGRHLELLHIEALEHLQGLCRPTPFLLELPHIRPELLFGQAAGGGAQLRDLL